MKIESVYEEQPETANEDKLAELIEKIENRDITLSFSAINNFMKSPRHFLSYKLKTFEPTPAMIEGDLIDCLLTEPDEVENRFLILPEECSLATHAGLTAYCDLLHIERQEDAKVAERREWVKHNLEGVTLRMVSEKTYMNAREIARYVYNNDATKWILNSCTETQKPVSFEAFGWEWRGKMDIYGEDILVCDMKLTVDAEYRKFHRQIEYMGYLTQSAIYTIGPNIDLPFFFAGYDRNGHICVIEVPKAVRAQSWERLERVMGYFERCIALGEWSKSYDFWAKNGIYQY